MFTGLVEEIGEVTELARLGSSARLGVRAPRLGRELSPGESVAVSGACLTVTAVDPTSGEFHADVMAETLGRTGLGGLRPGSRVNLERALTLASRLGGHLVQGHVDATAAVLERLAEVVDSQLRWEVLRVGLPAALAGYLAVKGSVALDGVSLTVSAVGEGFFEVSLIPATLGATTLGEAEPGTVVNVEVDVVAKYVERLLAQSGRPR